MRWVALITLAVVLTVTTVRAWRMHMRLIHGLDVNGIIPGRVLADFMLKMWMQFVAVVVVLTLVVALSLWSAQDAQEANEEQTDQLVVAQQQLVAAHESLARTITQVESLAQQMCDQAIAWQSAVLGSRQSDVRIATTQLNSARAHLRDTQEDLRQARQIIGDPPFSIAEQFFIDSFERDVRTAESEVTGLEVELVRRQSSVAEMENQQLSECPP